MSSYEIRRWGNEHDEWPEKRVSIVDEDGHAIAISPRYANENTIKQMEFLATAPRLADKVAKLEAEVKILTEKILRISAINWLDMGWIHGHQARDAIKKALKGCSDD